MNDSFFGGFFTALALFTLMTALAAFNVTRNFIIEEGRNIIIDSSMYKCKMIKTLKER